MWSGSLLTNFSGSLTGAHQRINRIAYKYVKKHDSNNIFPDIKDILHFEGKNGPDGIKAKSPAQDEPWHYFNPHNTEDTDVIEFIKLHFNALVDSLKESNRQKSAFEASWLAHAIVDGLTPAHHYPYEEELEKLRGEPKQTRSSIKRKIIIPGTTKVEMVKNNWKMWGAKGLFTTHGTFELGVAMILMIVERKYNKIKLDEKTIAEIGIDDYFRNTAKVITLLNLYETYYKSGWTTKLSNQVRKILLPTIIKTVAETWLYALKQSKAVK
jgi:hypothetical protein